MKKLLNGMKKFNDVLGGVEKIFSVVLMIALVIVCMIFILCRYVIHISVPWSDEFARYILIMMGWVGASYCVYHDDHLRIQALSSLVRGRAKNGEKLLDIVEAFTQACICVFMIYFIYNFVNYLTTVLIPLHAKSSAMHIPLELPNYPIVVAASLMALHSFIKVFLKIGEITGMLEKPQQG